MSRENVRVMREFMEAWNRREIDAMLSRLHAALEFRTSGLFPDLDPVYEGHAGFTKFYRESVAHWSLS